MPDAVARRVAASPQAPAVWDGSWLTYGEFGARVRGLAAVLRERGCGWVMWWGCACRGALI
nr:hypothetical protein GCM10020093_102480 [Planobispora longispora]